MSPPTYLDRYPAKMVGRLATQICKDHVKRDDILLDPFCGSGAILRAASPLARRVTGFDINPYATLLSKVRADGFNQERGDLLVAFLTGRARSSDRCLPLNLVNAEYWFTPKTLEKYGRLRYWCRHADADSTPEGRAALLALALTARRCSRADQRSPKPFISASARSERKGRHFDPLQDLDFVFQGVKQYYAAQPMRNIAIERRDILRGPIPAREVGAFSIVITSPPYLNAQDYYRNSKLELALLEDLVPFRLDDLRDYFIGTERGDLSSGVTDELRSRNVADLQCLSQMELMKPRQAAVIHKYLADMRFALLRMRRSLSEAGSLILICGDNLIGAVEIRTWAVLEQIASEIGFRLISRSGDEIVRRHLPPKRLGHRGLIKKEMISHFRLA